MKELIKEYYLYVIIFLIFLCINIFVPMIGDDYDWAYNQYQNNKNFIGNITNTLYLYNALNGRLAHNFFAAFFCNYRVLWIIVSAMMYTFIIFFMLKIFNKEKDKKSILLGLLLLLCIPACMRKELQLYATVNIAYCFSTTLIFIYIYILHKFSENKTLIFNNKYLNYIFLFFFAIFISLWIENLTLAILSFTFLYYIYNLIKKQKNSKYILFGLIGVIIGSIILFFPSGPQDRLIQSLGEDSPLKLAIKNSFFAFNSITFANSIIFIIFSIISIIYVFQNKTLKKHIKKLLIIIFSVIIIYLFLQMTQKYISIDFYNNIFNYKQLKYTFAVFMLLSILFIILSIKNKKHKLFFLFLYIASVISVGSVLVSPGYRNMIFALYVLILLTLYLFTNIIIKSKNLNKIIYILLILLIFVRVGYYMSFLKPALIVSDQRNALFEESKKNTSNLNNKEWLILPKYNEKYFNENSNSSYYLIVMKNYYELNENTIITFNKDFYIERLESQNIGLTKTRYYFSNIENHEYKFVFKIYKNKKIYKTYKTFQTEFTYNFTEKGAYYMKCDVINKNGNVKTFRNYNIIKIN